MTILLVDTFEKRRRDIATLLQKVVPNSLVMSMEDPLFAAKYAFGNPVDLLFAQLNMKRLSGLQVYEFVKENNPNVVACLLASEEEFANCPEVFDESVYPMEYPVAEDMLRLFFKEHRI